jgi:oxygen-independent coproporphyrinogen-3 oxidase
MKNCGIYVHVPFCAKKCPYCDFYSCSYRLDMAQKYTDTVVFDIEKLPSKLNADTIYFGGGTPSLLPVNLIDKILRALSNKLSIEGSEVTIEINPCTVNEEKLRKYKDMGINRLSFGIQSANENELEFLGRNHSFGQAEKMVKTAKKIGFDNISCDMMIGLPYQTSENIEYTIKRFSELEINHISSYILKIEENTPFNTPKVLNSMPDDDTVSDLYLFMVEQLKSYGFNQYEISNFSKPEYESRHNLKYWKCQEYIGLGPGAHSYFDNERYYISANLDRFVESENHDIIITDSNPATDEEKIMLGLRLTDGINTGDFPERKDKMLNTGEILSKAGLVLIENGVIRLTPKGFLLSNSIITELIM